MGKGVAIRLNNANIQGDILDLEKNIVTDSNGKILCGFSLGPVTEQNIAIFLIARPGELKGNPMTGVALVDALLDDDLLEYRHEIRKQFKQDGLIIDQLELYQLGKTKIKAHY